MKKFFVAIGKALVYFLTYLLSQIVVTMGVMIYEAVRLVTPYILAGETYDLTAITMELLNATLRLNNLILVLSAVLTLGIYLIVFKVRKKTLAQAVGLRPVRPLILWPLLLGGVALQFFVTFFMAALPIPESIMMDYAQSASVLDEGSLAWQILAICICAPLMEEILFRGLIYRRLKHGMPTAVAMLLQALVFGVMHGNLLWFCYAACLGLLLGLVYENYQSLWACIALHAAFNASSYLMLLVQDVSPAGGYAVLGVSALALAALVFVCIRQSKRLLAETADTAAQNFPEEPVL